MELFGKTAALCIVCAVLALLIRKKSPEFAFCAVTTCCAVCLLAAAELIAPVLSFLGTLQKLAGLDDAVMAPLLKTVGIGLLTQAACAFCQDAGQSSLAKTVELCGTFLAVYVSLPLAEAVLELLRKLIGG